MKKFYWVSVLAAAMAPIAVQAASVDLTVSGTVIPTACIPAFAGGSNVDLGRIYSATLSPSAQNNLPSRDITLRIACDAPASVEIAVTDNRGATKVPGLTFNGRSDDALYYGLGSTQGVGIGGFSLEAGQPLTDGNLQLLLVRSPTDPTWRPPVSHLLSNAPTSYSGGPSAAAGPAAARLHTFPIRVEAAIRATSALPPTTDEFLLDGSVTFDVYYL
ncbi:DUF1120 domain-containing protein [Pseudomonas brassicacearum]|uniref:DUF1120 domain-containing protein n=1 Tax=Pseudomonas brassicacearum TaxID=930166 RepID=A0A423JG05_9PSED|nr:DUF1120 domain-containing protein [Pseudomonas brassicacearum]RON36579.1 hypothetical protein BK664_19125 [Pseudomonas brassicacearum]